MDEGLLVNGFFLLGFGFSLLVNGIFYWRGDEDCFLRNITF